MEKEELNEKIDNESKEEKLDKLKKKHEQKIKRDERKEELEKQSENLKKLMTGYQELQNKNLYLQAEFANYKKRREEESARMLKYKNEDIALELLNVIDSFERAINVDESKLTDDVKKYLVGFKMINNNLVNIMNKFEIKEIDCLNKEFDHNTCQALMMEHRDNVEPGIVIEVLQKGYMLKDKLLRASLVKVSE